MWVPQSISYVYFLMFKSNHGCHAEFEKSCSLSGCCTPFPPPPAWTCHEDKQISANLVLVLTVLVATKALMLRDFLGADFHKSQGCCLLTSIICLPTLPIPCLGPWNARVQWQTVAVLSLMWLSYVDRNMAPSVTSKPSSIPDTSLQNKVTFQDEWYLGALFWEMKLAKVNERKASPIRALIFRQKATMQRSIWSNKKKGHKQGSPQHRAVYLPSCTVTILHYWAFIFT